MKSCPDRAGRQPWSCLARWVWLWLLASGQLCALEYELAGLARDEPRALDVRFEVCVRDCAWRIRCWHEADPGLAFESASLSAGELIRIMNLPTQHWATAVIESNQVPIACEESATSLLWLLLASACYWPDSGAGLIPPVYDSLAGPLMDRERTQRASWQLLASRPHLPRTIAYWNDGYRRLWDSRTRSATRVPLAGPYRVGFTNAVGGLSEFQRVGELVLPRSFWFAQYGPGGHRLPGLQVVRSLTGRVEVARAVCSHADLVPRPPFRVMVQDRRLVAEGPSALVTYAVRAGEWPGLAQLRRIRKRQMAGPASGTAWQLALFCLLALAPLVAVRWWRQRTVANL